MNEVECEHCGKSHNLGDRFCPITGQPLGEPEAPRGITRLYNPKGLASEGPEVEVRGTPVKTRTFWTLPRWGKGKAVPPHTTPLSPLRPDPHARTDVARLPGVRSIDRTRPPPAAPPATRTTTASVAKEGGHPRPSERPPPRAGATGPSGRPSPARPTPSALGARPTRVTPASGSPPPPRLPPPPPPPLRSTAAPARSSARLGISPLEPTASGRPPASASAVAGAANGSARGSRPSSTELARPRAGKDERAPGMSLPRLLRETLLLPLRQGPAPLLAGTIVFLPGSALFLGILQLLPRRLADEISGRAMLAAFLLAFVAVLTLGLFAATVSLAVSDRLGGRKTPFHRYPLWLFSLPRALLASIVVAAGLVAVGVPFLALPGAVLLGLFAFVPFVALYDLEPPRAALRRALRMAGTCPVRLGVLCALGLVLAFGAHALAGMIVQGPPGVVRGIVGGVLALLAAYPPVVATFLLYLDVKRAREGFGEEELQAALEAVRPAREPEPVAEAG